MKLQNEVQMAWFQHPVNEAREARGLPAVNSIWFHAQGTLKPVGKPFARVLSASPAALGLARAAQADAGAPPAAFGMLPAADGATLVELPALTTPFIEQDWARWHDGLAALESATGSRRPCRGAERRAASVDFTLCGDTSSVTLHDARRPAQVLAPPRAGLPVRITKQTPYDPDRYPPRRARRRRSASRATACTPSQRACTRRAACSPRRHRNRWRDSFRPPS